MREKLKQASLYLCLLFVFMLQGAFASDADAEAVLFVTFMEGTNAGIATALEADGWGVETVVSSDFSVLLGDLSSYTSVFISGIYNHILDESMATNLESYVASGGYVLYTGYDAVFDPQMQSFLGGTNGWDSMGEMMYPISTAENFLTTGVVDIRGVQPIVNGMYDLDELMDLTAETEAVLEGDHGAYWSVRTLGSGKIAWVSSTYAEGNSLLEWEVTATDGSGVWNAAIRNFAYNACPIETPDTDGDGYRDCIDCQPLDPTINPGVTEICDGIDNNCREGIDEDFNVGDACSAGVGECVADGVMVCAADASATECGAVTGDPSDEFCDDLDNDCDGETDEDFDLGEACTNGVGECVTSGTKICAADGSTTECDAVAGIPDLEFCDGLDNDCDGETDEDFDKGTGCTAAGICGAGFKECSAGGLTTICNSGPGGSNYQGMYEMCNDIDDNCDGETDEIYNKDDSCSGVGVCPMGTLECYGDYSTICSTSYGGSQYAGSDELCDSLDNDCDGYTDEMWPQLNTSCTSGGDCGAGLWVCKDDYTGVRCTADDNANDEICDGYDNDCNGQTDEEIQGALSVGDLCNGEGECGWGYFECDGFYDLLCSTEPGGSEYDVNDPQKPGDPESCDGKDNDCDGETDENFDLLGDPVNCGECGWVCQFDNATAKCVDGQCLVDECGGDYLDMDGDPDNGCECLPDVAGGGACTEAYNLSSNLTDDVDGTEVSIQSTLTDQSEVLWYRFYAVDAEDNFCDHFHVFARFTDNPGNRFVMDVYTSQGGCSTTDRICPTEDPVNVEDFAVDFRVQMDYYDEGTERGECPCVQEDPSEGYHLCSDNSQLYYLKVYYLPGTTPTCDPFELTVSNGWLSGLGPFSQ